MIPSEAFFKLVLISYLLIHISHSKMKLSVVKPKLLQNHFASGLEFKEIINGHRLQSFEEQIDIHMLKDKNATGCHRFNSEDVTYPIYLKSITK